MNQEQFEEIEKIRETEPSVKRAFATYAEKHGGKASSVQAAYYQYKKSLKPEEPKSLADRLRVITSEVADMENLLEKYLSVGK